MSTKPTYRDVFETGLGLVPTKPNHGYLTEPKWFAEHRKPQPKLNGYVGDTASILLSMFGPPQYDRHVHHYRAVQRERRLVAAVRQVNENLTTGRPKWENVR